jgi:MYXO-CTERM domain-containing protein
MRAAIRPTVLTLIVVGATFAATEARADVAAGSCDTTLACSSGGTSLHAESRAPIMSSMGTGWLPACAAPDAQGHCSDQNIQVAVSIDLAALPAPSAEPLWMLDMQKTVVVDTAWPTDKAFELSLPLGATSDGTFKVSHSLIPEVRVHATLLGFTKDWLFDTSSYLAQVAPAYRYSATNTVQFKPWGIAADVVNVIPSPALTTTTLLDLALVSDATNDVHIAVGAKTSPTFTYRTTKVTLANAPALTPTVTKSALPMVDADFLDLLADVEGVIKVAGDLTIAPYVQINKIGGYAVPGFLGTLDLSSALNAPTQAYTAAPPVTVKFPSVKIHIPLPNVKVPTKSLDLGAVQLGQRAEGQATIANTGEMGAKLTFESSDPQFTVTGAALPVAKTNYVLPVHFAPTKEGPQTATITMRSNDPDSPVQTFTVQGTGSAVPVPPAETTAAAPAEAAPSTESGCGCRTAPVGSSYGGLAGLALAGLLVARRRRAS